MLLAIFRGRLARAVTGLAGVLPAGLREARGRSVTGKGEKVR